MRRTTLVAATTTALAALMLPTAALAHHQIDRPVDTGEQQLASHATDNVELIGRAEFPEASDMFFQRRTGPQQLGGQVVDRTTDLVFIGGDGGSAAGGHVYIYDVTTPEAPVQLADIPCGGFHSEVVAWENYLVQAWDGSASPCAKDWEGRNDLREHGAGLRIYDISDPANPVWIADRTGAKAGLAAGVHNATVNPEAGLVYLNLAELSGTDPEWGYVDLTDPTFPVTTMPIRDISPTAVDGCHDLGLDLSRDLAACAAIGDTFLWDISDPKMPVEVGPIYNNAINIHHGARFAPDGTLVLNDELTGAAAATGCAGTGTLGAVGALWFYDTSMPEVPLLEGSYSTAELAASLECTSHFYNFVPGTSQVVTGWYESGMIVTDFSNPTLPTTVGVYDPDETGGASFWAAYTWHGHLFGSSRADDPAAGGLYVVDLEGLEDGEPTPNDEGLSWASWNQQLPASAVTVADSGTPIQLLGSDGWASPLRLRG